MSDPDMEETLRFVHSYIVCNKVKDADRVDGDTDFIPVDENLADTSHVSMFHRYIQTPLNPEYETLREAIKVNHYQENQCWLNIIGAGDVKQLPPVCGDLTNTRNAGEYSDECIDQMFKYNILLKVCKRLGLKDDPKASKNR